MGRHRMKDSTGMDSRYQYLGPELRRVRRQARVSQPELARRLGVGNYQTIQKWESGERSLTLDNLVSIARALGHVVDEKDGKPRTEYVKALFKVDPAVCRRARVARDWVRREWTKLRRSRDGGRL